MLSRLYRKNTKGYHANLSPALYLKFAKDVEPEIFENKTPKFNLEILNFIENKDRYKAVVVFRGAGKTTLLNKIYILSRLYFYAEHFTIIVLANEDKAICCKKTVSIKPPRKATH